MALTCDNFCTAAWNAFCLMLKNAARFGMTHSIGFVYMFFGAFLIASLTAFGTYIFLTNYPALVINSPVPATIVMAVIGIAVGWQFLSIFSYSQDAILQSFLLDEELRLMGNNRPEYMQEFA